MPDVRGGPVGLAEPHGAGRVTEDRALWLAALFGLLGLGLVGTALYLGAGGRWPW